MADLGLHLPSAAGARLDRPAPMAPSPPRVAAVAYMVRGGLVAGLTRADTGEMAAPGGKAEPGESPEDAVRRELREETGLVALRVRRIYEGPGPNGFYVVCFLVEVAPDAELRALEPGTRAAWVEPEVLASGFKGSFHRRALEGAGLLTPAPRRAPERRVSLLKWWRLFWAFYTLGAASAGRLSPWHPRSLVRIARLFARFAWRRWRTGDERHAFENIVRPIGAAR